MTREEVLKVLKEMAFTATETQRRALEKAISAISDYEKMQEISLDLAFENDELINKSRWIPVSEMLPEDHKDVLICLSSDQICIGCYNSHILPFSNNAIGWGASYTHNWGTYDVVAWMEKPEPYKKGGE